MLISERFEGAVGPCIQNPVLCIGPGILGFIFGLIPLGLDLGDQGVLVGLSSTLRFGTFQL